MKRQLLVLLLIVLVVFPLRAQDDPRLRVIATTTIIADLAANVGGDLVAISALVPPNTDVHAFEARPSDLVALSDADLLLVNGAGLETFLSNIISNLPDVEIVIAGRGVPVLPQRADATNDPAHHPIGQLGIEVRCELEATHEDETAAADHTEHHEDRICDPHIWGNPQNVMQMVANIAAAFAANDPKNAQIYQDNAAAYQQELQRLDEELMQLFASLSPQQRVLVTNHEFLAYVAARYDLQIIGTVIPGASTLAEPSAQALAALVERIEATGVRAIFAEVSETGALADVVAAEVGDDIQVITLFSEALSEADGPAATYLDYMRFNARAIVDALSA